MRQNIIRTSRRIGTNPFFAVRKMRRPSKRRKIKSKRIYPIFFGRLRKDSGVSPFTIFKNNVNVVNIKKKKSDMTYDEAKRKFPKMNPFGDADKDGIENWMDCRPFNKNKQGKTHKKSKIKEVKIPRSDLQKAISARKMAREETAMAISRVERLGKKMIPEYKRKEFTEKIELPKMPPVLEYDEYGVPSGLKKQTIDIVREEGVIEPAKIEGVTEAEFLAAGIEKRRKAKKEKQADIELMKQVKKAEAYERLIESKPYSSPLSLAYNVGGAAEKAYKSVAGSDLLKGVKTAVTKRQSEDWDRATKQTRKATMGIFGALTATGGIGSDSGPSGGPGRPRGSYKYGRPIQEIRAIERERKRQMAMQMMAAEQRRQEYEARMMQRQMAMEAQQQGQMQPQPESGPMEAPDMQGREGFITPEMVEPQEMVPAPRPTYETEQKYKPYVMQPPRKNPWGLLARWRPNLNQKMKPTNPIVVPVREATTIPRDNRVWTYTLTGDKRRNPQREEEEQ